MPHFAVKRPSWWNSNDHLKNAQLKVGSPPQLCHDAKHFFLQPPDQESATVQMTGASYHKVGAVGRTNSQDQCISSESDQDEGGVKAVEGQMKPIFLLNNPDVMFNTSQVAHSHSMAQLSYPYAEPCFSGLLTAYGPHAIIQPQMVGIAPARVPLPLDLTDDGPIYVNPKQYHGILRRRQSRAKLEAQNKVVKARKPYLHESRHRHALNRIRGSGGRFVSTRKLQDPNLTRKLQNSDLAATSSGHCVRDSVDFHPSENRSEFDQDKFGTDQHVASLRTCSDISSVSNSSDCNTFQQPNRRFSGISPHLSGAMQCNGGLVSGGPQHCASVVR